MATQGRRRALGQHFLRDKGVADAIAEAILREANQFSCLSLLEIGPGQGAITLPILEKWPANGGIQKFILVERDQKLGLQWQNYSLPSFVQIQIADFLDLPVNQWCVAQPVGVVSNLPYSAGTALLTRLSLSFEDIPVMILMFQEEVAKRIRAEPSTSDRGSLSLWIQNRWDVKKFLSVPPRAFSPAPQVNSEVIILTRRSKPRIEMRNCSEDEAVWQTLLKNCFAHRRKMLRTVIPCKNALGLSGVDGTKRAEALDWDEWNRLFQATKQIRPASYEVK